MRLLSLACIGPGALDAAMPSPNEGCITRNGTSTLPTPKSSAGSTVGRASQLNETMVMNPSAYATPMT